MEIVTFLVGWCAAQLVLIFFGDEVFDALDAVRDWVRDKLGLD